MTWNHLLPTLLLLPILFAAVSMLLRTTRAVMVFGAVGTLVVGAVSATAAWAVLCHGPLRLAADWLRLDLLSALHLGVMAIVYALGAVFGLMYFLGATAHDTLAPREARRYGGLWFGSMTAMVLVLESNNLGVMWVGVEATTLLTAFLICTHATPKALEAMWKYLLMCSVGVAVAFLGTLLVAAAAAQVPLHGTETLLWSRLIEVAPRLPADLLKAGFIFMVVGYGTKAGLAPMHNWLPDAHSQAPAPVSALFSGFLLNTALYCILRVLPLVEAATGNVQWGRDILMALGTLSVLVAAGFIATQHDLKRMLAYSSVEHLGIMTLGAGLGGAGAVAALLHMLNHSLTKPLAFFCAGKLGQQYGTHDMRTLTRITAASPTWGRGLVLALLALVGMAPFGLFLSEFLLVKALVDAGAYRYLTLLLVGLAIVFAGALRHLIAMAWAPAAEGATEPEPVTPRVGPCLFVYGLAGVLVVLGLWLPAPLMSVLTWAAALMGGN